jgi:hypothetical protein
MARMRQTLGGRRSHGSPKANLGQETHSRVARGQPRAGDAITTRSRPKPQVGYVVMPRPRPTSDERCSHVSPEANPRRET